MIQMTDLLRAVCSVDSVFRASAFTNTLPCCSSSMAREYPRCDHCSRSVFLCALLLHPNCSVGGVISNIIPRTKLEDLTSEMLLAVWCHLRIKIVE